MGEVKKDQPVYKLSDNYRGDNGQKLNKHRVIVKEMIQEYTFTYQDLHATLFAYQAEIDATAKQIAELIIKKGNLEKDLKAFQEEVAAVEGKFPDLAEAEITDESLSEVVNKTEAEEVGDQSGDEITNNTQEDERSIEN